MAKFYGNAVKTGKLGGSVFAIRYGETIERQYQPVVANPSTVAQVEARAKLKLVSQLSAILAPVIAIAREGAMSSRNLFTKVNYTKVTYSDNTPSISLPDIALTRSVVALPTPSVSRSESSFSIGLGDTDNSLDRVVYVVLERTAAEELRLISQQVVNKSTVDPYFTAEFNIAKGRSVVILAYGMRDNTDAARTIFGNLTAPTAQVVANLIVTRTLLGSDVTLTETKGVSSPGV